MRDCLESISLLTSNLGKKISISVHLSLPEYQQVVEKAMSQVVQRARPLRVCIQLFRERLLNETVRDNTDRYDG